MAGVREAGRVCVLELARWEQGDHVSLLVTDGIYAPLVTPQARAHRSAL